MYRILTFDINVLLLILIKFSCIAKYKSVFQSASQEHIKTKHSIGIKLEIHCAYQLVVVCVYDNILKLRIKDIIKFARAIP